MQSFSDLFDVGDHIEIYTHKDCSIQNLFQKASIMVTDYSSVAFEMALLQKAVLYYQFDQEDFFGGEHTYYQGYYDYELDGFGSVCIEEKSLLDTLEEYLSRDGEVEQKYLERMQRCFPYRDTENCRRVYEAIERLRGIAE